MNTIPWSHAAQKAAEYLTFEVIETRSSVTDTNFHEGWGCHLLNSVGNHWALIIWEFGSCARCDPYWYLLTKDSTSDECYEVLEPGVYLCTSEAEARSLFDDPDVVLAHASHYCHREDTHRRLKALWSSGAAEFLNSMFNIDAEHELTSMIAQEIANDIDIGIMRSLTIPHQVPSKMIPEIALDIAVTKI